MKNLLAVVFIPCGCRRLQKNGVGGGHLSLRPLGWIGGMADHVKTRRSPPLLHAEFGRCTYGDAHGKI